MVQALTEQLSITIVSAVLLAEPEPDRAAVEVHQTSRPPRPVPSYIRGISGRYRRGPRQPSDDPRGEPEVTDDTQFPAVRRCFTHGRVRYNQRYCTTVRLRLPGGSPR